jgi:peptide/nickel transport system ATP-binding protein/oligopeptide transport system ATP-binding protein
MTPILEVRDLTLRYPVRTGAVFKRTVGEVTAVDGVSLRLEAGRTLGLVGESGSGKSSLARLLVGIEKPSAGQVLLDGEDISRFTKAQRHKMRREVQLIFQDPYTSLNPRMSVGEIVGEAYAIHRDLAPEQGVGAAVRELLELVGLDPNSANRYPHQFSGGQRQRIGIARALAVRPRVLVCDEPVSALDVSVQGQVINLLESLQDELGLAYLFIAHDLSVVRHIADEVAVMYLGRLVESGSDVAVYDEPRHPYTRALMSAVPVPDPTVRGTREEIILEGDVPSPINPPSGCHFHTRCWLAPLVHPGEGVPELCRTVDPALEPQEAPGHLAACHFAEQCAAGRGAAAPRPV